VARSVRDGFFQPAEAHPREIVANRTATAFFSGRRCGRSTGPATDTAAVLMNGEITKGETEADERQAKTNIGCRMTG
jgi:hypothetical protein